MYLLSSVVLAAEVPTTPPEPAEALLEIAVELIEAEDPHAARGLLTWILDQPQPASIHSEAEALLSALPADPSVWGPRVRLATWQAGLGTALFGPGLVGIRTRYTPPGMVFATGLLGGAGGAAGALLYAEARGLTAADATAIVLGQQLGIGHGLTLGAVIEERAGFNPGRPRNNAVPTGLILGSLAGSGLGYGLAELDLGDGAVAGAYSGALWGMGLSLVGLGVTYRFGEAQSPSVIAVPLVIGADLGVVGGYLLAEGLGLNRASVWGADLGAAAAMAVTLGFMAATAEAVPYTPHAIAWGLGGAAIVGGGAGILLTRDARPQRLPPVALSPSLGPHARGLQLTLSL